ncbi:5-formyltetrahydrofolate cyclo-ligase [Ammoniphilus resinae]|uniref:5-formyltetrahydrofolate cyclo-ligase n=1 Tax=Ammoniphilus resinae TaxID=861532 RepID=A0ABS4GIG2_9BACL|nr:5-formyltetrahydrofolate cyclo-ligase [Ammoniphilus resinae]MBP1930048.1 5-formyltetrahydrofolate cyclo-ligase [Ammoniphilus resinae]
MDKKHIRKEMTAKRNNLNPAERAEKSRLIRHHLLTFEPFQKAQVIFTFIPFGSEVDLSPLIQESGKKWLVPKTMVEQKRMDTYLFPGWDALTVGVYGIREPDPATAVPVDPKEIELVLVPGLAFDPKGGRLGYGGGYYDRFLAQLSKVPLLAGICFSEQIVPNLPIEAHDIRMDYLISDKGIIVISN